VHDLKVTFDIRHTYIGDLTVTLKSPAFTKVLHDKAGRNAHDLHVTMDVPEAANVTAAGRWTLSVVDSAAIDVGTLDDWKLDFGLVGDAPPDPMNRAPLANAGPDLTASASAGVDVDGSASSDPDSGDALSFKWTQSAGAAVTLTGATT